MTFKTDSIVYNLYTEICPQVVSFKFTFKSLSKKKKKSDVLLTNSMPFSVHSGPA